MRSTLLVNGRGKEKKIGAIKRRLFSHTTTAGPAQENGRLEAEAQGSQASFWSRILRLIGLVGS